MRKIGLGADGNCSLCHHEEETIDYLFKNYNLAKFVWSSIDVNYQNLNDYNSSFIDWLEHK